MRNATSLFYLGYINCMHVCLWRCVHVWMHEWTNQWYDTEDQKPPQGTSKMPKWYAWPHNQISTLFTCMWYIQYTLKMDSIIQSQPFWLNGHRLQMHLLRPCYRLCSYIHCSLAIINTGHFILILLPIRSLAVRKEWSQKE